MYSNSVSVMIPSDNFCQYEGHAQVTFVMSSHEREVTLRCSVGGMFTLDMSIYIDNQHVPISNTHGKGKSIYLKGEGLCFFSLRVVAKFVLLHVLFVAT